LQIATFDLVLLLAYLAATVAFGMWIGRGQKSASDYLLGNRNLPWWALLISIVATETSTATFLSVPGIAYGGNLTYLQLPLGYLVGRAIAAAVLLPLYFQGQMFTAYEVLRVRSGPGVRTVASGLFLVTRTLADGLRLYLAAVVVQTMTGYPLPWCVGISGVATLVYTLHGGIRAVVWTDVVQFFVYMLGALAALVVMHERIGPVAPGAEGGLPGAFALAAEQGKLQVFDFGFDLASPFTFWAGLLGGTVLSIGSHGVDQLIVQRYLSARTLGDARKALLWSGPVVLAQFAVFLTIGIALFAFYKQHPPEQPLGGGDRVFADFIVRHLPTGLVGIVLGAVFSAAMSTLSSSLSASASALVNDFVLPATGRTQQDPFALRAAKAATVLFAVLQMAVGVSGLGGADAVVNSVLSIATVTTGIILGVFLLALPARSLPAASLVGLGCGIAATAGVVFAFPVLGWKVGWPWYGIVSCGVTCLAGFGARAVLGRSTRG
jgi:SSS family transporter